jgi:hypothetical protein
MIVPILAAVALLISVAVNETRPEPCPKTKTEQTAKR